MKKMAKEITEISGMKAISINVRFDKVLQRITGKDEHPVMMSEGSSFLYLLMNIFMEYPKIEKKYQPGKIGFTINGIPPRDHSMLFDGDTVDFSVGY